MLGAVAGAGLLALAAVLLTALLRSGEEPAASPDQAGAAAPAPAGATGGGRPVAPVPGRDSLEPAVRHIFEVRGKALEQADAGLLDTVYTKDCNWLRPDRQTIADFKRRGVRLARAVAEMKKFEVTGLSPEKGTATVAFTRDVGDAELVRDDGFVVERQLAPGMVDYRATLDWDGSMWRLARAELLD